MRRAHHPKSRFFLRGSRAELTILACVAACVAAGCVDPQKDYDDYRARTDATRGVVPTQGGTHTTDGGTSCSLSQANPPTDFSATGLPDLTGTYFAECLARLALCDTNTTLRYRGTVSKTGEASYTFTYQPLAISSPTVATVVGTSFNSGVTLKPDGSFVQTLDNVPTPGSANPFSGNDLTIQNATFTGYVTDANSYCAELDGTVVVLGQPISLDGPGDICLFRRVESLDEPVHFALAEFHCP